MAGNGLTGYLKKLDAADKVNRKYPYRAAVLAVNFSKDRFRQQNWIGDRTEPWKKRQFNPGGRATLTGKGSGSLKRSIRITSHNASRAVIGTDKAYAQAHNEGMKIPITDKMRGFFMAKAIELKESGKTKEASYFFAMASPKKKYITIPRRQFMGNSQYLTRQIDRQWVADIAKALKT